MMEHKKVIIIGAGIVGLSTAYYLAKAGFEVEVIDQTDGNDNCSFGNAGYVAPSHFIPLASPGIISQGLKWMLSKQSPFYIKPRLDTNLFQWGLLFKRAATDKRVKAAIPVLSELTTRSKALYEQIISNENIEAGYKNEGLLMICQTEKGLHHELEAAKIARALGLHTEGLSKAEVEKLDPNVAYQMKGAVYFGCDAWMSPHVFMQGLKEKLLGLGVKLHYGQTVQDIALKDGSISHVSTQTSVFEGAEFVMTTGAWTGQLMKKLKINMPLQGGKGYSFMLQPEIQPKLPSILVEGRIATTPMLNGWRIAGTMELCGINAKIDQGRVNGIIRSLKEAIPIYEHYDFSTIKVWSGLRPCSPDGLPYIGKVGSVKNLHVGTGHAMLGWTLGPVTGELIAESIVKREDKAHPLLRVDRYH